MGWPVILDPGFPHHPKMVKAGPLGRELVVAALCHCNRGLTDGEVTVEELRALTQYDGLLLHDPLTTLVPAKPVFEDILERLVVAGIFEWHDGVIHIHDYDKYQSTREKVLDQRARWRDKKRGKSRSFSSEKRVQGSPGDSEQEGFTRAVDAREAKRPCEECGIGGGLHLTDCSHAPAHSLELVVVRDIEARA
jgi:hypothetical protein